METTTPPQTLAPRLAKPVAQGKFQLPLAKWREVFGSMSDVSTVLNDLPTTLGRPEVAQVVLDYGESNTAAAFVTVMMWGYGDSGYGPHRTQRILHAGDGADDQASKDVLDKLRGGAQEARKHGPVNAFRLMNNSGHVTRLGPAFFTKWLHFSTWTANGEVQPNPAAGTAPIYDQVVRRWMARHAGITLRPGSSADYERYVGLLRGWGAPSGLNPAQIEEQIFILAREQSR